MNISIVGLGIDPNKDLTRSAIKEMREGKRVFVLGPKYSEDALNALGIETESIYHLYGDGNADRENYDRICNYLIEQARLHGDVVVAIPGHPSVGVTVVNLLRQFEETEKIKVKVLPGISSMDLYIYHVCSVGTRYAYVSDPMRDNHILKLKEKLLQFYPTDHECYLLSSSAGSDHDEEKPGVVCICELGCLEQILPYVSFASTLLLHGCTPKGVDETFLDLLKR